LNRSFFPPRFETSELSSADLQRFHGNPKRKYVQDNILLAALSRFILASLYCEESLCLIPLGTAWK